MKNKIEQYQVEAMEYEYDLVHVWQGFDLNKANKVSISLILTGWRDVKVVKMVA